MVKRTILNPNPRAALADLNRRIEEARQLHATRPHGVKDMGAGDSTWTDPVTGEQKSVKRFSVELDDTTERARELAEAVAAAEETIAAERERLIDLAGELDLLDTRVEDVDQAGAKRVSAGPVPPTDAPLGAQWITPEGRLYVRVPCEEVPSGV